MAAQALSWRWSSVRSASADQPAIRASGSFNTGFSQDQAGFPTIQSLSGQRNGIPITSFLATGSSIPGNCIPSTCFKGDNLVRQPGGAAQLTSHGFGVGFADGTYANYFFASFLQPAVYLEYFSAPPFDFVPPGPEDSELSGVFRAIPVPGPLPFGAALMGWGWSRRLRRRLRTAQCGVRAGQPDS